MAQPDPRLPQLNDPELETELTRVLSIVGPLGKLNIIDAVLPVISMGNVVQQTVEIRQPSFRSTDVFSAGFLTNAAINTVHADTGALAAGVYDMQISISVSNVTRQSWSVEHRDAANAANLALWGHLIQFDVGASIYTTFGYEFAINERLRVLNVGSAFGVGEQSEVHMFARRRT